MSALVQAPLEFVEAVAALRLAARPDRHLQRLMDRNTEGALSPVEREELESLVELSETISLLRARGPQSPRAPARVNCLRPVSLGGAERTLLGLAAWKNHRRRHE